MRVSRTLKAALGLVIVGCLSVTFVSQAQAYYLITPGQRTYFRNVLVKPDWTGQGVTAFDMIRAVGPDRNYSEPDLGTASIGYVIPNKQSYTAGPGNSSGGALGTTALNISGVNDPSRKLKLFTLLKRLNTSGTTWEKMGSALVVHQMLQKTPSTGWGDAARTITPTEWTDLEDRLVKNPNVTMEYDGSFDVDGITNTEGVYFSDANGQDVIDAISGKNVVQKPDDRGYEPAWVFRENGVIRYIMEVNCANPLGDFDGFESKPQNYNLTPSVRLNKSSSVDPGEQIKVTSTVKQSGDVQSDATIWQIVRMNYDPSVKTSDIDMSAKEGPYDACGSFSSTGRSYCQKVNGPDYSRSAEVFGAGDEKSLPGYLFDVPSDTKVGTKICFTTSVSRPTQASDPIWRHSTLACVVVAKKPKMQVWGGDLYVGKAINTNTSTFGPPMKTYGSWSEYAALSNGSNGGFGSGAGLNKGNVNSNQGGWSALTFANIDGGSCSYGCFNFVSYAPSISGQFKSVATDPVLSGSQDIGTLGADTYKATDLTITGGTIGAGKTIIIDASKTVTITGDITYSDGPYSNVADIPQLIIKAKTIRIVGSVGVIDSWLIASAADGQGTINTCSDVDVEESLTDAICNKSLQINGPVVTDKLYLRRTAGSNGGKDDANNPAEVFNLRPDAYLWGSNYGTGNGKIRTVYTKELPPRL